MIITRTDKDETWFIMKKDQIEIARMCAELVNRHFRGWLLKGSFVLPDYRRQGVFSELWSERLSFVMSKTPRSIEGWCCSENRPLYLAAGFTEMERDGNEALMRKVLKCQ